MIRTTLGQLLVNDALPEELRDYNRKLDKRGTQALLGRVAQEHPDRYLEVSKRLSDIGRTAATDYGGSIAAKHLTKSPVGKKIEDRARARIKQILDDDSLTPEQRNEAIIRTSVTAQVKQRAAIMEEGLKEENPLAIQAISGSRGTDANVASLRGSDWLYSDHHGNIIPVPVYRSYSQGLSPMEYWVGTYGARKGVLATKFAVRDAGYLSKQLNQISHRLVVTDEDDDNPEHADLIRGLPVDTADMDNEGALLARDIGGYHRNTALTPKILKDLERRGFRRILIRSPMVGGSPEGGVYSRDVGVREKGLLPGRGEQVGLQSAQAVSEPIGQGQLNAKHTGGIAGADKALSGFDAINQLVQVPKTFKGGAAMAEADGRVERVEPAPAGGQYVYIDGKQHYVAKGFELKVKRGDEVEAGDILSEGLPDPSVATYYKGHGEGRNYFVNASMRALRAAGMKPSRRNLELIARGLINHVRLTEETDDNVPGDIVPYQLLEHTYKPRPGFVSTSPTTAVGKYLERPVLHYTIGTKIRPSMLKNFDEFGVSSVDVHDQPPPFEPEMVRGMYSLHHDPDWQTRFYGSGQKASLLDAVHRGATSSETGTSFVPSLIRSVDFGRQGIVRSPEPGIPPQTEDAMPRTPVISPKLSLPTKKPSVPLAPSGGWFKAAEKTAADLEREAAARVAQVKAAQNYDPTGSSGPAGTSAGNTGGGTGTQPSVSKSNAPVQSAPQAPSKIPRPAWLNAPRPEGGGPPQPTATRQPGGDVSYAQNARQRAGIGYGGYQPSQSLFAATDNPMDVAEFVAGNPQLDHTQGYGGEFGAAMRFMTALDPSAAATLTGGSPYAQNNYGSPYGQGQGGQPGQPGMHGPEGGGPEQGVPEQQAEGGGLLSNPYVTIPAMIGGQYALEKGVPAAYRWMRGTPRAPAVPGGGAVRGGSILSRTVRGVGKFGKPLAVVNGALNLGMPVINSAIDLWNGDTEAAKRNWYDHDYNLSMADSNRSYLGRSWEALDPSNFARNVTAMGEAAINPGTVASGAFDNVAGLVGMDQQSRHNREVATPEYQARIREEGRQLRNRNHQQNLDRYIANGWATVGPDERPRPTPAYVDMVRRAETRWRKSDEEIERGFLSGVFNWRDDIIGNDGTITGWKTPDQIWQEVTVAR